MKAANDIFTWLFQSGAIVWLFYFAITIAKPWVDGKVKHAKTAQQREAWELLEQVAMTTVNSLVSADKPGNQKFDEASTQVASYLADHGIKMDMGTIQSAVQAAYEKSPLTTPVSESTVKQAADGLSTTIKSVSADKISAGKIHTDFAQVTPITASAPTPAADPVMDAIAKAPNRANDVKEAN